MARLLSRRSLLLDGAAAVGFALLPQVTLLRTAAAAPGSAVVWLLSVAAAAPLTVRRIWPVPVFAVVLAVACVAVPFGLGPAFFLAAAYALYAVAVVQPRRRGLSAAFVGGVSVAVAVGLTVGGSNARGNTGVTGTALGVVVMGATWAAGRAVSEQREATRRAIRQTAEQAKVEERLRIARDMHDVVTHSMGLIAIKASVANHVLVSHPEEASNALVVIEDVSRGALREMRAMLGVLRTERAGAEGLHPVPSLPNLRDLTGTAEAAGVQVELDVRHGDEIPDGVALSAFRIVQEALTNVVKHAAPTSCRVRLTAESGAVTIEVTDDGPRSPHRRCPEGGGLGLIGMWERAAAHGGTVTAGPRADGGFSVNATLRY